MDDAATPLVIKQGQENHQPLLGLHQDPFAMEGNTMGSREGLNCLPIESFKQSG